MRRRSGRVGIWLALALVSTPCPAIESVEVMGLFPGRAVVSIDGKRRTLSVGRTSPEGVTLVSADSEAAVLEFDGHRRTFGLGRRISTIYRPPAERPVTRIWPTGDGMYRTVGTINGFPVSFLVDTGATQVAMSRTEAHRLGIDYLVEGRPGRAHTAAGDVVTYSVVLRRVQIGEIVLSDVPASVIDRDSPADVLLGNSVLDHLELRREGRALELRERR